MPTQTSAQPHMVECRDCLGSGEVTPDHPHDPNGRIFKCEPCGGYGELPCENIWCDCRAEERANEQHDA